MLTQVEKRAKKLFANFGVYFEIFLFEDVLQNVVPEGISHEVQGVLDDLVNKSEFLILISAINALLHDTAAMLVASNFSAFLDHRFKNKLIVWGFESKQDFLDNVVAVYVFDQRSDMRFEQASHFVNEILVLRALNYLLNGPRTMGVLANADNVLGDDLNDLVYLVLSTGFSDLLAQVVAKRIVHKVNEIGKYLIVYLMNGVFVTVCDKLLQHSTSGLVLCEIVRFLDHFLGGQIKAHTKIF